MNPSVIARPSPRLTPVITIRFELRSAMRDILMIVSRRGNAAQTGTPLAIRRVAAAANMDRTFAMLFVFAR